MTRKFVRNKNDLSHHFDGMYVGGVYHHRPCTDTSGTIATPATLAKNYSHPSRSSHHPSCTRLRLTLYKIIIINFIL